MATGPNPQFRFVKCPKCRRVLPEVPNVPVYRCGGCGALLQAKSRKNDEERTGSGEQEAMVQLMNGSGDKEPSRLKSEAKPSSSNCSVDYNNDQDQKGCKAEEHEAVDLSSNGTHKSGDFGSEDCDMEGPAIESEAYSSTELVHNEPKDSWPFTGRLSSEVRATEEEVNNETDSAEANGNLLSESEERVSSAVPVAVAADVPLRETTLSIPVSPPREEPSRGAVVQGFGSMRSIGTSLGPTEYASPESEFSCIHRDESKLDSPMGRYDGSISSYDGQLPDRYVHSQKTSHHKADKLRRDQFLVDSMTSIDSQAQHQPKTKLYDMSEKGWNRQPRNLTRVERNDKVPLHRRSFQGAGYGSVSSFSSDIWDLGLHSSGKLEYQRQEKMKLLRMIRELQDQLDKSHNLEGNANVGASTWKEKNTPSCYDHGVEATWHEPNYPMRPATRLGQQSTFARMSFSGEAPNSRHHIGSQCLHCHPQDWKHSAPQPPSVLHHRNGLCTGVPSGYACCNPESSCGSSLQRYIEPSEFSTRLKDHVLRKYMREKPVVAKKHFRPKAGGAPFVTCYRCSKLLLLPEDFLLFKKRYYKLRCGACSTVLKFSVQNRTHIIPYSPNVMGLDPHPSEADECSGVMNRRSMVSSHSRLSRKSCSIEGGNFSRDRKMSSLNSMEKRKELIQNRFRDKYKDPVEEAYRPSSSSSKPRAARVSVQRSNSPLHRLMGYSSPSLVIRGIGMSPADTSS